MSINTILIILLVLVTLNAGEAYIVQRQLFKHQKALEWFAAHIHLDPKALPNDAPEELLDMIERKEDVPPDK